MTNHAEDICRILHMAKVFPCLFRMGKTDNHNYTRNNDKITLFISLIHSLQTNKQTNKQTSQLEQKNILLIDHRQQLGRLSSIL